MKNLKVTVNGQVYDVVVEESDSTSSVTTVSTPPSVPAAQSAPVQKQSEEKPKTTAAPASGEYTEMIKSPMPGTIMSVEVTPGQKVSKGDTLLILEAMKMENEIVSPIDATVGNVMTSKGDTVESGTQLLTLI